MAKIKPKVEFEPVSMKSRSGLYVLVTPPSSSVSRERQICLSPSAPTISINGPSA